MIVYQQYKTAQELPNNWDELAENYFQKRDFLTYIEKYNPCQQRYYQIIIDDKIAAFASVYTLNLDLLTYLKIKSPIKMKIVGIPVSVSSSGIFGEISAIDILKKHIYNQEKGFILMLNLNEISNNNNNCASGPTLPSIILHNNFEDFNHYIEELRSDYRRRYYQIFKESHLFSMAKMKNSDFNEMMYNQYVEVYQKSKGKLEKLNLDFFRNLPEEFKLTALSIDNQIIGWNIYLIENDTLYFFLGGINYKLNLVHKSYLRLLYNLIKEGIELKVNKIDLGQTAEIPKMKLGGIPETKYMEAKISNKFLNHILKQFERKLTYNIHLQSFNVFKQNP
jgi:hypothetical protein